MTRTPLYAAIRLLAMVVAGVLAPCLACAEAVSITGIVTAGPFAAPMANAEIIVRVGGVEQRTRADASGRYELVIDVATPATMTLLVQAEGLRPLTRMVSAGVDGTIVRADVHLTLAEAYDSVLVSGVATAVTRAAEVAQTIDDTQIAEVPSVTRSMTKYALLDPHVRQAIGLGADFQDSTRLSINAGSYRHTGYVLDGTTVYDWIYANAPQVTVSPASVSEMRVMSGPAAAQYGQSTTGLLSIVTASGTSQWRGSTFLALRPDAWQARPPLSPMAVPNSRRDAGVTVGGPLGDPRTVFTATYERIDQDRGAYIQSPQPRFFTGENRDQQALLRIDRQFASDQAWTVRLNASESTATNANDRVAGFNQPTFGRRSHAQSAGGQLTARSRWGGAWNEARLTITAYTPDSATPFETSVQVVRPNYATEGFSTTNWVHARTIQAGNHLTLVRGRHQLGFGGEIVRLHARDFSSTPYGTYTFAPGPPQPDEHPLTYTQTFGVVDLTYGQTQGHVFVQDTIALTPRLTTTVGLRYEAQSITDARANLGPRGSVAWDLRGDGRTILRGGAGILYDQYYMYLTRRYLTLGPQSPQSAYSWSWGDPAFPTFPASFAAVPEGRAAGSRDIMIRGDRLLNPFSRQVTLSLERRLGGMVVQVAGLDSHTFRQMRVNDINHPEPFVRTAPNQVRTPQAANLTRPYTTWQGVAVRDIALVENTAESIYRSLDLGVTSRSASWGQFGVHYVRSSSIAYAMFYADANSGVPNEWLPTDAAERGPSDFHQPHRMVANAQLQLPHDVRVALVSTAASGLPVNPITGRDNNGDSYTVDRPIGLGRNSFRGPAQFNTDLAVARRVRLGRDWQADLRVEVFNLFNQRNFIRVNNIYGEGPAPLPSFLTPVAGITNVDPSRQLQVGLTLVF